MRVMTGLVASLLCAMISVIPYLVTGTVFSTFVLSAFVGFALAYFSYTYHIDPINSSPLDAESILMACWIAPALGAAVAADSWWTRFWLAGLTSVCGLLVAGGLYLLIMYMFTGDIGKAIDLIKPSHLKKDDEV